MFPSFKSIANIITLDFSHDYFQFHVQISIVFHDYFR